MIFECLGIFYFRFLHWILYVKILKKKRVYLEKHFFSMKCAVYVFFNPY